MSGLGSKADDGKPAQGADVFLAPALAARCTWRLAVTLVRLAVKLVHAALLAGGIAAANPASAEIDASQADARLIGMPIYTSDGLLIGQVTGVEIYGSSRSLVAAVGSFMGFGTRAVWIPLNWAEIGRAHV